MRSRAMFGEYSLYCGAKVVALICNDQVFLKPTWVGEQLLPGCEMGPAYSGAKPSLIVPETLLEDSVAFSALVAASAAELPEPKPKKKK